MIAKRIFDLVFATLGLLLLTPVFVAVAIWIKLDSSGPIFFRQERVGRFGRIFRIHKFRTMRVNAEAVGPLLTVGADPRITRSGTFLRAYKLDELPQLLNVIQGDMSLVGPRPEVPQYLGCSPDGVRELILSVPPGMTDFAAIEFKDENRLLAGSCDPEHDYIAKILPVKCKYYEKYVRQRSLWVDFALVLRTLRAVFSCAAGQSGEAVSSGGASW